MVKGGNPRGKVPTSDTPWEARSKTRAATIDKTTATSTLGTFGNQRCKTRIKTSPNSPMARAAPTVSPSERPWKKPRTSAINVSPFTEKPNSLGS